MMTGEDRRESNEMKFDSQIRKSFKEISRHHLCINEFPSTDHEIDSLWSKYDLRMVAHGRLDRRKWFIFVD